MKYLIKTTTTILGWLISVSMVYPANQMSVTYADLKMQSGGSVTLVTGESEVTVTNKRMDDPVRCAAAIGGFSILGVMLGVTAGSKVPILGNIVGGIVGGICAALLTYVNVGDCRRIEEVKETR